MAAITARADESVTSTHGVVIAGHPEATRLGLKVLADGGNAIDALVTTSLALGVAEPGNSGLGGKFVMTYYDAATRRVTCVVAMDAAPLKIPVQTVTAASDATRSKGWTSVCVPGLAAALGEAHAKWGSKPWKDLLAPDIALARHGVVLSDAAADMLSEFPAKLNDPAAMAIYAPTGKTLPAGQTLRNPDLADTLADMAEHGYRSFYTGPTARKIVAASQAGGGYLSAADFETYRPRFLPPTSATYHGLSVYSSPPPLTGGTTLLTCLECLEPSDVAALPPRGAKYVDLVGRVLRQVYPAVAANVADVPDAADRAAKVLDDASVKAMRENAAADDPAKKRKRVAMADVALDDTPEASTTHLIVADAKGNVACVTQSLGLHFGAGVVAGGTGVLFNADVSNFSFVKSLNSLAPGKWPRSTMTPTLFCKDGRPVLAIGSPAGQRIPTAVLQVSLDVLNGRDLRDAIRAPRFHVVRGKDDNHIDLEAAAPAGLEGDLAKLGWDVQRRTAKDYYFGSVNAVQFKPDGTMTGVADQRRTSDAGTE